MWEMRGKERKQLSEETEREEDADENEKNEREVESETVALVAEGIMRVAEGIMRAAAPPVIVAIVVGEESEGVSNTRSAILFRWVLYV